MLILAFEANSDAALSPAKVDFFPCFSSLWNGWLLVGIIIYLAGSSLKKDYYIASNQLAEMGVDLQSSIRSRHFFFAIVST